MLIYVLRWRPSWIPDRHKKQKICRGPSNDYSWAVWFQLSKWFQRRSVLKHFSHRVQLTGPVNDNINMDSTITVWTLVVNWLLAKKIGSVGERPLLWVRHHRLAGLYNKRTKKSLKISVVVMMFNATFNNISVISWQSVLLVEETGVTRRKSLTFASHWLIEHIKRVKL